MDDENLTDYKKRIFIREYIHFLQNITCSFGHLHALQSYDRLKQTIAKQQHENPHRILIPVASEPSDEQALNLRIKKRMEGDYKWTLSAMRSDDYISILEHYPQ